MKNIVICSDGTGNVDVKGRGTNVFKTFEAVDLTGHRTDPDLSAQIAFYDDGVGTETLKPLKIFSGMTGFGLSRNVRQLYKELARVYDPGDRIFLFGFSRGAFTVRSLVGFIATCGLLDTKKVGTNGEFDGKVREAYRLYRQCYRTPLGQWLRGAPDKKRIAEFQRNWCHPQEVRIAFIGVWDTVDAVGLPFHLADVVNTLVYRFKFPDCRLSDIVDCACHALAIDDERHSFAPLLWDETRETKNRITQVWFSGAHSNVGGGYPKQGMSLVALDWMMAEATRAGLRYDGADRLIYRNHANVDDKLYDPRAGLGLFYRWKVRDIETLCNDNGIGRPQVHVSVLERAAHGTADYAPGNLPRNASIVVTEPGAVVSRELLATRAQLVQAALHTAQTREGSLLDKVRGAIAAGLLSYYLYIVGVLLVLGVAAGGGDVGAQPASLARGLVDLIKNALTSPLATSLAVAQTFWARPALLGTILIVLGVSYGIATAADVRMDRVFSSFWHQLQQELRKALKQARSQSKGDVPSLPLPGSDGDGPDLEPERPTAA
jgi:uncharacterized protein (DUF2235 family)